jgi:hypothetical protein
LCRTAAAEHRGAHKIQRIRFDGSAPPRRTNAAAPERVCDDAETAWPVVRSLERRHHRVLVTDEAVNGFSCSRRRKGVAGASHRMNGACASGAMRASCRCAARAWGVVGANPQDLVRASYSALARDFRERT